MSQDLNREQVQEKCRKFLEELGKPSFIIMGWKNDAGTLDTVQSVKKMKAIEYFKSVAWALHEIAKKL